MSETESDAAVEGDEIDVEAVLEEPAEQKENQHDQPPDYEPPRRPRSRRLRRRVVAGPPPAIRASPSPRRAAIDSQPSTTTATGRSRRST